MQRGKVPGAPNIAANDDGGRDYVAECTKRRVRNSGRAQTSALALAAGKEGGEHLLTIAPAYGRRQEIQERAVQQEIPFGHAQAVMTFLRRATSTKAASLWASSAHARRPSGVIR